MPSSLGSASTQPLRVGVDLRCLTSANLRGFSRYTHEIVCALARREGITLIGYSDRPIQIDVPVPIEVVTDHREFMAEQIQQARMARRLKLDVLFCPANRGLPLGAPIPTVLTLHDAVEWDRSLVARASGKSRLRFAYASIASLASASRIITVSTASAAQINSRLRVRSDRLRVVYEGAGVQFTVLPRPAVVSRVMGAYGLNPGYVMYLGGFDKKKDVATLIRAYARMSHTTRPPLVLGGGLTSEVDELKALASSLGVGADIRWLGFVDEADLPALYSQAACFVFPAVAEGFGLPVLEAMTMGVPVVVANAGSLPEVVSGGGQYFRPGDDDRLASIVTSLISDPSVSSRWAANALERSQFFSWDKAAEQTERILREAAQLKMSEVAAHRVLEVARGRCRA